MSLVGFRARNHPQQAVVDHVDDRRVLPEFFAPLHVEHRFTVDAAASAENAMLPRHWSKRDDALQKSWAGERVWCNPPYSNLAAWAEKVWTEMLTEQCPLVVMLAPANRCEQLWWQRYVEPFRDGHAAYSIRPRLRADFLPGRMRFGWPADRVVPPKGDRPPFGCVLLTWTLSAGSAK